MFVGLVYCFCVVRPSVHPSVCSFVSWKSLHYPMICGELGIFPITTEIQTRIISFWSKLIENSAPYKLSPAVYNTVYNMHENRHLKSQWLDNVKNLLCSRGYSGIWYSQSFINAKCLISSFMQNLKDSYIQKWYSLVNISSSNNNYRLFKDTFETSSYIKQLPHFYVEGSWLSAPEIIDFLLK